ncbi:MAG: peptidase M23 [Myxococcales bacterium]|nr:peptidase M23 [Myxococcales bacterium]
MKPVNNHLAGTLSGKLDRPKDLKSAAQQLEAVMVKKMLESSGAFRIKGTGGDLHSDLFTQAISQAISKGGGFGLTEALMRDFEGPGAKNSTQGATRPTGLPNLHGRGNNDPSLFNAAQNLLVAEATRISSDFGYRVHPIHGDVRHHDGIDIAAPKGSAITAPKAGVVAQIGNHEKGYGNFLVLDHGDGTRTLYAHADTINVKVGEKVKMGDKLATVGNTGDSTGAHLHFEVQRKKSPIDPGSALKKYGYESK